MIKKFIVIGLISILLSITTSFVVIGINSSTDKIGREISNFTDASFNNVDINEILDKIDKQTIEYYLNELLKYPSRYTGSNNCENAGRFIYTEFKKMGKFLNVEEQTWDDWGKLWIRETIPYFKHFNSKNIIASIPGEKPDTFIFSAHYDCNENSPGALDNGAGVASLLTIAKVLSDYSFENTIQFIAFSGEEQGLLGAYAFAKEFGNILGVLNVDVIGNNTYETNKYNQIRAHSSYSAKWLVQEMVDINSDYNIGLEVKDCRYFGHSDDKAFDDYGYPAMQLFQSGNNMESIYGSEDDTIDLINLSYLTMLTKLFAGTLAELGEMSKIEPNIKIISPEEDTFYKNGEPIKSLSKGITKVSGDITVEVEASDSDGIEKVVFELLAGENEGTEYPRNVLDSHISTDFPYSWTIEGKHSGWHTIRVTASDKNDSSKCDEIEINFVSSIGAAKIRSLLMPLIQKLLVFKV